MNSIPHQDRLKIVIQILTNKLPENRTNEDIQILVHALQKLTFWQKLNQISETNILHDYCKHLRLEQFKENTIIYKEGEYGEIFYILLNGQLNIDVEYFGEECLQKQQNSRTIICQSDCIFAYLDFRTYNKIVMNSKLHDINQQIQFFKKTQIFGKLGNRTISQLLCYFQVELFERNQVVYYENEKPEFIYIVKTGEFEFSKKFRKENRQKRIPIANIGPYELFGDLDCLLNKPRFYTVTCVMHATCYKISIDDFYQRIIEQNHVADMDQYLNQYIKSQMLSRQDRIEKVTETIEYNSNFLMGVKETVSVTESDEIAKIELHPYDKTHSRYAQIYNSLIDRKIMVRYATIHKTPVAIPRCSSKTQGTYRVISISAHKISPQRKKPENLYDEIEVPDQIKRKYQKQLMDLQKQQVSLRKQQYKIRTFNNNSQIIAYNS
ncbi:hypothetical protein pb186bvf_009294 [Paramecium bursaria]